MPVDVVRPTRVEIALADAGLAPPLCAVLDVPQIHPSNAINHVPISLSRPTTLFVGGIGPYVARIEQSSPTNTSQHQDASTKNDHDQARNTLENHVVVARHIAESTHHHQTFGATPSVRVLALLHHHPHSLLLALSSAGRLNVHDSCCSLDILMTIGNRSSSSSSSTTATAPTIGTNSPNVVHSRAASSTSVSHNSQFLSSHPTNHLQPWDTPVSVMAVSSFQQHTPQQKQSHQLRPPLQPSMQAPYIDTTTPTTNTTATSTNTGLASNGSNNSSTMIAVLCVGHTRAVSFFRFGLPTENVLEPMFSITLLESPKSMFWLDDTRVVIGTKQSVFVISSITQEVTTCYTHPSSGILKKLTGTQIGVLATPLISSKEQEFGDNKYFYVTKENITYLKKFKFSRNSLSNKSDVDTPQQLVGISSQGTMANGISRGLHSSSRRGTLEVANQQLSRLQQIKNDVPASVDSNCKTIDWGFPPSFVIHMPPFIVGVRVTNNSSSSVLDSIASLGTSSSRAVTEFVSGVDSNPTDMHRVGGSSSSRSSTTSSIQRQCHVVIRIESTGQILQSLASLPITGFSLDSGRLACGSFLPKRHSRTQSINNNTSPQVQRLGSSSSIVTSHTLGGGDSLSASSSSSSSSSCSLVAVTGDGVFYLRPEEMDSLLRQLCDSHWYRTALNLISDMKYGRRSRRERVLSVQFRYATFLFTEMHLYQIAIDVHKKYHANPSDVLELYPELKDMLKFKRSMVASNSEFNLAVNGNETMALPSGIGRTIESVEYEEDSRSNTGSGISQGVNNKSGKQNGSNSALLQPAEENLTKALLVLMRYLTAERLAINEMRQDNIKNANSMRNQENVLDRGMLDNHGRYDDRSTVYSHADARSSFSGSAAASTVHRGKASTVRFFSDDLPISYCEFYRRKFSDNDVLNELAKVVDTALLKVYLLVRPALVAPLLRVENYCDAKECAPILEAYGMYEEYAELYKSARQHEKALSFLIQQWKLKRYVDTSDEINKEPNGRQNFTRKDFRDVIVKYLRSLNFEENLPIVMKYSEELMISEVSDVEKYVKELTASPQKSTMSRTISQPEIISSVEIFLDNYQELSSDTELRIIKFLDDIRSPLAIRYCEYVIFDRKSHDKNIHNEYVKLLCEYLLPLSAYFPRDLGSNQLSEEFVTYTMDAFHSDDCKQLIGVDELVSQCWNVDVLLRRRGKQLFNFLRTTSTYDPKLVEEICMKEEYVTNKSITKRRFYKDLLSAAYVQLDMIDEALNVYLHPPDFNSANGFCESIYDKNSKKLSTIFDLLATRYIAHLEMLHDNYSKLESLATDAMGNVRGSEYKKEISAALNAQNEFLETVYDFAESHVDYLTVSKFVKNLPKFVPLTPKLATFLLEGANLLLGRSNKLQPQESILNFQNSLAELEKKQVESQYFIVDEHSICARCLKHIDSVSFAVTPRGDILHMYCV